MQITFIFLFNCGDFPHPGNLQHLIFLGPVGPDAGTQEDVWDTGIEGDIYISR